MSYIDRIIPYAIYNTTIYFTDLCVNITIETSLLVIVLHAMHTHIAVNERGCAVRSMSISNTYLGNAATGTQMNITVKNIQMAYYNIF